MPQAVQEKPLFGDILELVDDLPVEEQDMLARIVRSRVIERRRAQLAADIEEAREAHRCGDVKRGTVEELMAEIDRCVSS